MAGTETSSAPADPFASFNGEAYEDGAVVPPAPRPDEPEPVDDGPDVPPPVRPVKAKSAQERIDQAVKRQREAERERDEYRGRYSTLEERLARLEGPKTPLTTPAAPVNTYDPDAPDPAKYQYGELDAQFIRDLARYETRKEIEDNLAKREQAARQAEESKQTAAFFEAGVAKFPDFRETVLESAQRGEWPLSPTLGALAVESPVGQEVLYALATDHETARKIAAMSIPRQAAWFGALEAQLSAGSSAAPRGPQAPARTTNAPPPPARRVLGSGGNAPVTVTPDTQDFAAFEALARQANRRA